MHRVERVPSGQGMVHRPPGEPGNEQPGDQAAGPEERLLPGATTIGGGELLLPGEITLAPGDAYATPWVYLATGWTDSRRSSTRTCDPSPRIHAHRARST